MAKRTTIANNKYLAKAYGRVNFAVRKEEMAIIKQAAKDANMPVNTFIASALRARIRMGEEEFAELDYRYMTSKTLGTVPGDPVVPVEEETPEEP